MANFIPRTTAPSKDDYHYYGNDNPFVRAGYGMPNCTSYAWSRAYEILGTIPKLSNHQAEVWIEDNAEYGYPYQVGMIPKLGAIAVWSKGQVGSKYKDGDGHVAVVEEIYSDGSWKASNSAWKGQEFYLTTHDKNNTKSGYNFLGFIYLPIEFDNQTTTTTATTNKYKVQANGGLWLLDEKGKKIRIYNTGTEVTYLADGYTRYNYHYFKVQVSDGTIGYMAEKYLIPIVEPVQEPIEAVPVEEPKEEIEPFDKDKEIEELKERIVELENIIRGQGEQIANLQAELLNQNYKQIWGIEQDGYYEIYCNKGEVLYLK